MGKDYQGALQELYDSIVVLFAGAHSISDQMMCIKTADIKRVSKEIQNLQKQQYVKLMKGSERINGLAIQKEKTTSCWKILCSLFRAKQRA